MLQTWCRGVREERRMEEWGKLGKKELALLAPEFKNPIMTELGRTTRDFVQFGHAVSGTKIVVTVGRMSSAWKEQNKNVSGAVSGEGCDPYHRVLYCCSGTPRGWSPSSESRLILSSVSFLSVFSFSLSLFCHQHVIGACKYSVDDRIDCKTDG